MSRFLPYLAVTFFTLGFFSLLLMESSDRNGESYMSFLLQETENFLQATVIQGGDNTSTEDNGGNTSTGRDGRTTHTTTERSGSYVPQDGLYVIPEENVFEDDGGLGGRLKMGKNINAQDILYLLMHFIRLGVAFAGGIYMIINLVAGIQYIFGSISDQKEQGKNMLINGLLGFGVIIFSWIIIDVLITWIMTGR